MTEKDNLHPRNQHRSRYDFALLVAASPELAAFVSVNEYGDESVDFTDPQAVKALNRALLKYHYNIQDWDVPPQYLCPPIPGRADHLHHLADLLADGGEIPQGDSVRVLDIGVGANCIYPLIGQRSYGWRFVGTDIDANALNNAQRLLDANGLSSLVELRLQPSRSAIFANVTQADEYYYLTMSNPPFHASLGEAKAGTERKWRNLGKSPDAELNFGGQGRELWCKGGEQAFVRRMIEESISGQRNVMWFSTLISKAEHLPAIYRLLQEAGVAETRTLEMSQGQKKSRIVAWTFMDKKQRSAWQSAHAIRK